MIIVRAFIYTLCALLGIIGILQAAPIPTPLQQGNKIELLDGIAAVVITEKNTDIILYSDLWRPSINGAARTLEDLIIETIMFRKAEQFALVPSQEDVDAYLKNIQREHNLSLDQLSQIFLQGGYTFEEGRQQFARMQAVNALIQMIVIGPSFSVPDKEVEAYYQEHPEFFPASYTLSQTVVPFERDQDAQKSALEHNPGAYHLAWSGPFTIQEGDLAEDKQFICQMIPGEISKPVTVTHGFELYKLIAQQKARKKTFTEQKEAIITLLQKPFFEKELAKYHNKLKNDAIILYF